MVVEFNQFLQFGGDGCVGPDNVGRLRRMGCYRDDNLAGLGRSHVRAGSLHVGRTFQGVRTFQSASLGWRTLRDVRALVGELYGCVLDEFGMPIVGGCGGAGTDLCRTRVDATGSPHPFRLELVRAIRKVSRHSRAESSLSSKVRTFEVRTFNVRTCRSGTQPEPTSSGSSSRDTLPGSGARVTRAPKRFRKVRCSSVGSTRPSRSSAPSCRRRPVSSTMTTILAPDQDMSTFSFSV